MTPRLPPRVRLIEVGPRDGLQNEPVSVPPADRARLVEALAAAGLDAVEAGAFVSPKWVPQMAGTADVLARVGQQRVQVALMDTAMEASGEARVALLRKVTDSAKRFGNQLEARQVGRLTELAAKGTGEEATAAAALMGALNLPNSQVVPLILGGGEATARF